MRRRLVLLMALFVGIPSLVRSAPPLAMDEDAIVVSAQKPSFGALDYKQGDRASLTDAKPDFTADGWKEFMKRMDGWLDAKGAPLGSQRFTLSGAAVVKGREDGVIRLSIPGTLDQRRNASRTIYRVTLDVQLVGSPMNIEHLEPLMGGVQGQDL